MQILTIAGTVGKDAVLRTTQGGEPVLNFSMAVDNGKDAQGNKRDATWFDCSIWGKRATALQNHIAKGSKLTLSGRPTARAHDGKAYLGMTVNELSFQGGGQRQDDADRGGQSGSPARYADDDGDLPF
jgi:single-strand DNA-binding protein